MAQQNFSATVDAWCRAGKGRMEEVFKQATQNVIEEVIERTPRDTGFLVNSLTVTTDGPVPINPSARPPADAEKNSFEPKPFTATITGASLGSILTSSFVAAYARFVEFGAGGRPARAMVRLSIQRWQEHVDKAVRDTKAKVAGRKH